jgi:hypothetical protein
MCSNNQWGPTARRKRLRRGPLEVCRCGAALRPPGPRGFLRVRAINRPCWPTEAVWNGAESRGGAKSGASGGESWRGARPGGGPLTGQNGHEQARCANGTSGPHQPKKADESEKDDLSTTANPATDIERHRRRQRQHQNPTRHAKNW